MQFILANIIKFTHCVYYRISFRGEFFCLWNLLITFHGIVLTLNPAINLSGPRTDGHFLPLGLAYLASKKI